MSLLVIYFISVSNGIIVNTHIDFRDFIFNLFDLDENKLTALPPDIGRLGSLQYLDLGESESYCDKNKLCILI